MVWNRLAAFAILFPAIALSADVAEEKLPVGPTAAGLVQSILSPSDNSDRPDPARIRIVEAGSQLPAHHTDARAAADWLERNRASLTDVTFPDLPNTRNEGLCFTQRNGDAQTPTTLFLHNFRHHASGKLIAYGLSGKNLKRAFWLGDPKKDLKVEDTGRDLIIEVTGKNAEPPDPVATVIGLEFDGKPVPLSLSIRPNEDGTILLHAKDAQIVGTKLRYEPEPQKNTIGYWTDWSDWCRWNIKLDNAGTFDVELLQGCGKGNGGSEVAVHIMGLGINPKGAGSGDDFRMVVQDTGHFQNFVPRVVGRMNIGPGTYWVVVKPISKKGVAVMDLRQVTLKPVKE